MTDFTFDDGGRAAAGFRGNADDCVTRAIAIATGLPYRDVYDALHAASKAHAETRRDAVARAIRRQGASPRGGVHRAIYDAYLADLGWQWTPTMRIGAGTTVHLRADELPGGPLIARLSRHVTAVIDGAIRDTHDPSRDGTRAVYGIYRPGPGAPRA